MKTSEYVGSVYELCEEFLEYPDYVVISSDGIDALVQEVKGRELKPFPCSYKNTQTIVLRELLASSVNFCYWYGGPNSNTRRRGSSKMYELLDEAIMKRQNVAFDSSLGPIIAHFQVMLRENRFTMLGERISRLQHLLDNEDSVAEFCTEIACGAISMEDLFDELFTVAPEFAEDLFLKRAFLFPLVLNRSAGLFAEDIYKIPVPADYQIPKMLEARGVLVYSSELEKMIDKAQPILSGSLPECEIRASTIMACKEVAEKANVTMQVVDDYLFSIRKSIHTNHHLTVTPDY